jgi:hypothetical protein
VALAAGLSWAAGPHWLRHLLPGLPVIALAGGWGLSRVGSRLAVGGALVAVLAGAPANLGPVLRQAADRLAVVTGRETREAFLTRRVEGYPAIADLNAHLPDDAVVALLFDWSGYLIERNTILGSVEDHVPTRHWLLTHERDSLRDLRATGVTHVVWSRVGFIHKVYPFLSNKQFAAEFTEPEAMLEDLLLQEATLIDQSGRTRVYRLDTVPGHDD